MYTAPPMRATILAFAILIFPNAINAQSLGIPAEAYLTTHLWGSPSAVNAKHMAMGDASVADAHDTWHANPAAVVAVQAPTGFGAYGQTAFGLLPTFRVWGAGYAQPLAGGRVAVKATAFFVRADGPAAALGGLQIDAAENDVALEIGVRVARGVRVGGGIAYLQTSSTYTAPGVGVLTTLRSRPTGPGGRLGAQFSPTRWFAAGVSFDYYAERVTRGFGVLGLPDSHTRFTSSGIRAGVSFRPDAATLILLDREELTVDSPTAQVFERAVWKIGGERRIGRVALRAGLFGRKPTGGVAVRLSATEISYVMTNRYERDLPDAGARVAHLLQILHRF